MHINEGCSQWTALCIYLNWKFTISSHSRSSLRTVKWVFEENLTVKCSCRVVFPPGVRTPLPSSPLLLFFSCVQALFSWGRCSWPTCIRSSLCVCRVWFLLSSSHNIGKKHVPELQKLQQKVPSYNVTTVSKGTLFALLYAPLFWIDDGLSPHATVKQVKTDLYS